MLSQKRVILVNYCGYPSSLDSLMPDNGLANLAGSLLRAGFRPLILDYAVTGMVERLVPNRERRDLQELFLQYCQGQNSGRGMTAQLAKEFQQLNKRLSVHAQIVQKDISREIIHEAARPGTVMIAFKLWSGEGQKGALEIARIIREQYPDIMITGGGPHAECYGADVLDDLSPVFDAIATGEGEETIIELARAASGERTLKTIPGICFQQEGVVYSLPTRKINDLDRLAEPCYDPRIYRAMEGHRKLKLMMIDESRGCPYTCNFCFHPEKSGRAWRTMSAAHVADLMVRISSRTGSRTFRLAGSNPPQKHRHAIARELIRRGRPFEYISFGHTRSVNEDYDLLKDSGCVSLFFGVESGSQHILDNALNKRTTVESIRQNLLQAKQAGILTSASLITPCPFDNRATMMESVELMKEVRADGVSVYMPIITPRTKWFEHPGEFGIEWQGNLSEIMRQYQVRFLMPPPLWDPLPYTINGFAYSNMAEMTAWMTRKLEENNILTGSNDSLLVVGRKIGMNGREIRELNRKLFMTADGRGIQKLVERFNTASDCIFFPSQK